MAMAGNGQGPRRGGAPAREEEGEGVQEDRGFTRNLPGGKVWPEEGWRQRN
jgi:hypothetical protein